MKKILLIFLLLCSTPTFSENRRSVCTTCKQNMEDTEEYVCCAGYGHGSTKEEADSLAKRNAKMAFLKVARKSIMPLCREVSIGHDGGKDYLKIRYIDRNKKQERYYFVQDSTFLNTPICEHIVQGRDGSYHACCVLAASRKELNQVSNYIIKVLLSRMVIDYL